MPTLSISCGVISAKSTKWNWISCKICTIWVTWKNIFKMWLSSLREFSERRRGSSPTENCSPRTWEQQFKGKLIRLSNILGKKPLIGLNYSPWWTKNFKHFRVHYMGWSLPLQKPPTNQDKMTMKEEENGWNKLKKEGEKCNNKE